MATSWRVLLLAVLWLGFLPPASGQTVKAPARIEVSAGMGFTSGKPVVQICCALRTPPFFQRQQESEAVVLLGTGLRIRQTKALSTALRLNWGSLGQVSFEYPPSSGSSPSSGTYTAERLVRPRNLTLSVSESLEFLPSDRVRPYMSVGVALSRLSWEQENTSLGLADATLREVAADSWSFWRWGFTLDGGARFYPAGHFLIDTQGGLLLLREKKGKPWEVPGENPFFMSIHLGLRF